MISVLMPTRGRPAGLERAVQSLVDTAKGAVEVVVYVDEDDPASMRMGGRLGVRALMGPRIVLSDCWNKCAVSARGDLLMMGGDDMVMRTEGWDLAVEDEFAKVADRIVMVHGDDGINRDKFGVFPIIHRRWVNAVGYFVPPVFVGDYADAWLNDVALALGRRRYVPFLAEHMHPAWGKAEADATYRERWDRESRTNPAQLYASLEEGRMVDVAKLRKVIEEQSKGAHKC